jgi:hypothetical protein
VQHCVLYAAQVEKQAGLHSVTYAYSTDFHVIVNHKRIGHKTIYEINQSIEQLKIDRIKSHKMQSGEYLPRYTHRTPIVHIVPRVNAEQHYNEELAKAEKAMLNLYTLYCDLKVGLFYYMQFTLQISRRNLRLPNAIMQR